MSKMLNATDNRAKTGPNCFLPTNYWLTVSHCMIWGKKKKKLVNILQILCLALKAGFLTFWGCLFSASQ